MEPPLGCAACWRARRPAGTLKNFQFQLGRGLQGPSFAGPTPKNSTGPSVAPPRERRARQERETRTEKQKKQRHLVREGKKKNPSNHPPTNQPPPPGPMLPCQLEPSHAGRLSACTCNSTAPCALACLVGTSRAMTPVIVPGVWCSIRVSRDDGARICPVACPPPMCPYLLLLLLSRRRRRRRRLCCARQAPLVEAGNLQAVNGPLGFVALGGRSPWWWCSCWRCCWLGPGPCRVPDA